MLYFESIYTILFIFNNTYINYIVLSDGFSFLHCQKKKEKSLVSLIAIRIAATANPPDTDVSVLSLQDDI